MLDVKHFYSNNRQLVKISTAIFFIHQKMKVWLPVIINTSFLHEVEELVLHHKKDIKVGLSNEAYHFIPRNNF